MYWSDLTKIMFSFLIAMMPLVGSANEEAAAKESAGAAKVDENDRHYSGRQSEEWLQVQIQLTAMKGRAENQQKIVEDLIQKKETVTGAEQAAVIEELKKAHTEWIRLIAQFNQINSTFQTKFPEKGGAVGRVYKRIDPANIETLENKMTLEGRLQKLNRTIKKQYSKTPLEENDGVVRPSGKKKNNLKVQPEPIPKPRETQVTDQIILQK